MIAKIRKKYFEECEEAFSYLCMLLHRENFDYEIEDDQNLTNEMYQLSRAVKRFEKETGYELSVRIY